MTDYTKITDFAAKDTLPTGSAGKIIRGSEFETEFDNISTAIATKADASGGTLTSVDINSGTIDGTNIGADVAGTGAFSTLTAGGVSYPSADGTANQFLKTDGAGNLSFADALEDEGLLELTADATGVAANKFVQINSDGTVTQIAGSYPEVSSDIDTPVPMSSGVSGRVGLVKAGTTGKWIYLTSAGNYYVLDLTGTTPTISAGASVPGSGGIKNYHWNSAESVFVMLRDTEIYAATLSGTTLTFGSAADVSSYTGVTGGGKDLLYDERSNSSLFIWTGYEYTPPTSPLYIEIYDYQDFDAHVLSFSGTTITVNTGNVLVADADLPYASGFGVPVLQTLGLYNHQGASTSFLVYNDNYSYAYSAITISVSGTTVTAGAENSLSNLYSESAPLQGAFWDSTQSDFLLLGDSKYWTVGISGGTITTSADATFSEGSDQNTTGQWAYDSSANRYVRISYSSGSKLSKHEYSWDGSDLDLTSTYFDALPYTTSVVANVYDATGDNLFVIARESGTDYKGFFYNAVGSTNLAAGNAKSLGYSLTTAAAGETVTVKFGYTFIDGFTGLTPPSTYFIDETGSLSLTSINPNVSAGAAVTPTIFMLGRPSNNVV